MIIRRAPHNKMITGFQARTRTRDRKVPADLRVGSLAISHHRPRDGQDVRTDYSAIVISTPESRRDRLNNLPDTRNSHDRTLPYFSVQVSISI
ncbi:hypothetical protein PoB_006166100 [Plakobranchus ocellatus]|uniref:Uncharacterized protein n=1 Tax=Plakobranchus ocellatus TaxID=259542 RepID=A0AAV4CTD5_9GAST|nr:hypothetical protein PoB_006166100 [Plakobranchus ocellatus]